MRVLHLIDEGFAAREGDLLDRLEIGLADEGVRVFRAGPGMDTPEAEASSLHRRVIALPPATPWTTRRRRAHRLADQLESMEGGGDGPVMDVVHAYGGGVWDLAIEFGKRAGCPVVLEVWRARLAHRASALGAARSRADLLLAAPDEPIERELRAAGLSAPVRLTPWGVRAASKPPVRHHKEDTPRTIVIAGSGRRADHFRACVRGIAAMALEDVLLFIDAQAFRRARLWPVVETAGLLDRLTLVDNLEMHRELALEADALVHPEALGEQRTMLLDAMADGVAVVAQRDELVSWLIDGRTAYLVDMPDIDGWATRIRDAISDSEGAEAIRRSAWSYVRERRLATRYVASVIDLYEWAVAGPAMAIGNA